MAPPADPAGDGLPGRVAGALERARRAGFRLSSEPAVGRLLAVLAAGVPAGGRILELGTGAGVGLGWLAHGLGDRTDVEVRSVEVDRELAALARGGRLARARPGRPG